MASGAGVAASGRRTVQNEAKRGAQEALFTAIRDQAETNMKSALRATEKAELLRDLAEAYRLTAGGSVPEVAGRNGRPTDDGARNGRSADDGARRGAAAH
jgi:hypothetical protein